ncbi:hypothetical protein ACO0LB_03315 [Undibacterium sp. SXout7W]|uniref:hypothetical protein n=1 Tax=Undibacterium sp. SXout7W TaxID=3413049 RepID=UPI003BEFCFD9
MATNILAIKEEKAAPVVTGSRFCDCWSRLLNKTVSMKQYHPDIFIEQAYEATLSY